MRLSLRGKEQAVAAAEAEAGGADARSAQARRSMKSSHQAISRNDVASVSVASRAARSSRVCGIGWPANGSQISVASPASASASAKSCAYWSMPCTDGSSSTPARMSPSGRAR